MAFLTGDEHVSSIYIASLCGISLLTKRSKETGECATWTGANLLSRTAERHAIFEKYIQLIVSESKVLRRLVYAFFCISMGAY